MSVDAGQIAHWREWIGKSEVRSERLDRESLRRFAAAIGGNLDIYRITPALAHWAFFLPVAAGADIGSDGHPKRGGFLPPISLQRRMFAASDMRFIRPLVIDREASRVSTVRDVVYKTGRSGELILVEVEHRIRQDGKDCLNEVQTIVYRDGGETTPAVVPAAVPVGQGDERWQPGPVDLFRFSAVTFNSHRIHYDHHYATGEEGYPGLVVHGPFTAAKLFAHARRGGEPVAFSFRAMAPLFVGQPIVLTGGEQPGEVKAVRCDGRTAMTATAKY